MAGRWQFTQSSCPQLPQYPQDSSTNWCIHSFLGSRENLWTSAWFWPLALPLYCRQGSWCLSQLHATLCDLLDYNQGNWEINKWDIEILWQPLLTLSGGMERSWILLPYIWPSSRNPLQPVFDHSLQQLHTAIWIEPKTLFKDVRWHDVNLTGDSPEDHHSLGEVGFCDTWDTP